MGCTTAIVTECTGCVLQRALVHTYIIKNRTIDVGQCFKLELSRACTPRAASASICRSSIDLRHACVCWWSLPMYARPVVRMSRSTWPAVGTVDRCDQQNALFMTLDGRTKGIEAYMYWSQFFADFDGFILLTSHSLIPRSRDVAIFVVTTTTDRWQTDKPIVLPLAHACGVIMIASQALIWLHLLTICHIIIDTYVSMS